MRNDFLIDSVKKFIFQINLNTVGVNSGSFSDKMREYFHHFSEKYKEEYSQNSLENLQHKPNNVGSIIDSLFQAAKLFNVNDYKENLVVFVVDPNEINEYDTRAIQNRLYERQ